MQLQALHWHAAHTHGTQHFDQHKSFLGMSAESYSIMVQKYYIRPCTGTFVFVFPLYKICLGPVDRRVVYCN